TFWYLLTGRTPFVGRTLQDIHDRQSEALPWEQLKGLHLPAQCLALLKSMLALDPKDRPQTARDLLSAIHRCHTKFSPQGRSLRRLRLALTGIGVVLALAIALGTWSYRRMRSSASALPPIREKSIAVLPFVNLSDEKANAYFADGIQDEILTRLSKIADLKVISRTSTQKYKSKPTNLRDIAEDLSVNNVLEGSVQKLGNRVHINVQLIRAVTDQHLWAESYDRNLEDIFAVEREVAETISGQLKATLLPLEATELARVPTTDLGAYDLYLKAKYISTQFENGGTDSARPA